MHINEITNINDFINISLTKKSVFNNILNLRDSFPFLISYKGDLAQHKGCGKKH
jgi:hypothetical protein